MSFSAVASVTAVLFTVTFAWPQVVRALRHGVDGIAPGAIVQSLVSASMWFGYGVARRLPEVVIADVGVVSGQLVVVVLLTRARVVPTAKAVAVVALAAIAIALAQVPVLTIPVVTVGGVMGLTAAMTQLVAVVRRPHELEGLSAGSYLILTVLALAWLGYGFDHSDWAIIIPNIVMLPISSYVTVAAWRAHVPEASHLLEPSDVGGEAMLAWEAEG